jgi:hypothetical protein
MPAAVVPDRVLRPEPGLAGEPGRVADRFLVFGIGTEVLAVIALFAMFRRRG